MGSCLALGLTFPICGRKSLLLLFEARLGSWRELKSLWTEAYYLGVLVTFYADISVFWKETRRALVWRCSQ